MANALIAVALVLVLIVGELHGAHRGRLKGRAETALRIGEAIAAGKAEYSRTEDYQPLPDTATGYSIGARYPRRAT